MVIPYEYVGVGLMKDSNLIGTFIIAPPSVLRKIYNINMISSITIPFYDTWVVPSESKLDSYNGEIPLSPFEYAYVAVQSYSDTPSTFPDPISVINEE